jgi:hypothetical protein
MEPEFEELFSNSKLSSACLHWQLNKQIWNLSDLRVVMLRINVSEISIYQRVENEDYSVLGFYVMLSRRR